MRYGTKQLVEAALYGAGDRRRFTLDSPVLSDVWTQFFDAPDSRLSVLIEPWLDTPVFTLAEALFELDGIDQVQAAITYNRTVLVGDLSFTEVIEQIVPLTGWYREATGQPITLPEVHAPRLPSLEEMWDDLVFIDTRRDGIRDRHAPEQRDIYPYPRLLGMIRIAGLIAHLLGEDRTDARTQLCADLAQILDGHEPDASGARERIAHLVLEGWRRERWDDRKPGRRRIRVGPPRYWISLGKPGRKIIYSINRNRAAKLAIHQSVRTVKADAANALFSIDCSKLHWAIIDSGIDRLHPAFASRTDDPDAPLSTRSRVVETYDFSYLRELLTTRLDDWDKLPPHVAKAAQNEMTLTGHDAVKLRRELVMRIRRARLIDWEMLRPFLRIPHEEDYVRPVDPHGTHVAGILGADWDRDDGSVMRGMCPTINLIDIRVTRADGSSDEFVIMSALQFIRHLNANSDRMAVHGVNMSLSLEHDAAVYACGRTPVCEEAERTISSGVVVVAAAGNHGYRRILSESSQPFDQYCPVSITDPGNAENVITVGSTHRLEPHSYGVSYFSSRGPTGDGRIKPDLVAPGEKIYAPALHNDAIRLDGTSMAAPHVSGAAAMLMARHIELEGEPMRIKQILCATATDLGREPYFQGRGLVDVLRAIQSV